MSQAAGEMPRPGEQRVGDRQRQVQSGPSVCPGTDTSPRRLSYFEEAALRAGTALNPGLPPSPLGGGEALMQFSAGQAVA